MLTEAEAPKSVNLDRAASNNSLLRFKIGSAARNVCASRSHVLVDMIRFYQFWPSDGRNNKLLLLSIYQLHTFKIYSIVISLLFCNMCN